MDTTCANLKRIRDRVVVPHSIPGLVTSRVLTMTYLEGVPLTNMREHVSKLSLMQRKVAFQRVSFICHTMVPVVAVKER